MGFPMAQRLIRKGHDLAVFNRTVEKAYPLAQQGAVVSETSKDAITKSQCIILMLSDIKAIQETLFPSCLDVLKNKTVIQMGTIAPDESIELEKMIQKNGGDYFECPVLGSRTEAADGTLILMVGSSKEQFQKWDGFLSILGPQPRYAGKVGQAAALKLAVNQLIAAHAASFSLSLGIVEKNNVDINVFMEILRKSTLYAPMFDKKLVNWTKRHYENPNFPVKHMLKDVELILREAQNKDIATEVLDGIHRVLMQAMDKGLGDKDYSSLYNVVNRIS